VTLQAGRTLGHYEILSTLGAGGMGEVYRARDSRLGREVAIKLLLEEVAADPERLARFEREARLLASLNHPHIATLHGFETEGATKFLVMELVEGETLADRIARGPIALEEAIRIFLAIAEGLEAAHERSVVHRDLKPANIKLSGQSGALDRSNAGVKILDFGLAKALAEETAVGDAALSNSPTLTLAATQRGQIMGTAAYMSPQQAQGQPVDRRADIWAFGVCLLEALTGKRVFDGDNASLVLASVLKDEPDWSSLPVATPPALRRLLRRCLEKSARARLPHVGAARLELEEALVESRAPGPSARAADHAHPPRRSLAVAIALALTSAIALSSAVVSVRMWRSEPARDSVARSPLRYTVNLAELRPRFTVWGTGVRVSPDGSLLAILAGNGPGSRVYLRRRGRLDLESLAGTHGAWYTQFSPDGQWLLFKAGPRNSIHRIPIAGGAALPVLAADDVLGFDCDGSNRIVYDTADGLRRTSISGGEVEALTSTRETHGRVQHRFPQVLPRDRGVLFTVISGNRAAESSVAVLDATTKEVRTLLSGARYGRYASSGHLVYGSEGGLYAVPFDFERLTIAGTPARVVDDVYQVPGSGLAFYSLSDTGTLAYLPARESSAQLSLSWIDRTGRSSPLPLPRDDYATPALSPDGRALAVTARDEVVWIDLETGRKSQLTDGGQGALPIWASGGKSLVYSNQPAAATDWNIYRREAVGVAAAEMLAGDRGGELPYSIHGDTLLYGREGGAGGFDLYTVELDEPGAKPAPLVSTEADTAFG
jgi:serine/threonine-protein kinase